MDCIPENKLLCHNKHTMEEIRKIFNLEPETIREAIEILEQWIRKQSHFMKKDFSKHRLEMMLLCSKGSIERTKSSLDKMCTIRTLLPQYFSNFDIHNDFKDINSYTYRAILPRLTEDHHRVVILKAVGSHFGTDFAKDCTKLTTMYLEYLYTHDYNNGFVFIADCTELDLLELTSKLYPTEVRNCTSIMMHAMGVRLKGIHIISPSKVVEALVKVVKQFVSEKIRNRIQSHKSIESVYKFVPREILPVEYGGQERSYKILHEEMIELLSSEKFREYQKGMMEACTDESKRRTEVFNESYMGMPGTFRSLSVD